MAKKKRFTGAPGPSEISTWSKQIIPQQTTISGQPSGGFLDATGGSVGVNQSAKALFDMSQAERKVIAQALKNAGYRGFPVNGAYSSALANAYTSALMAAQFDATQLGQTFTDSYFTNFLSRETAARSAMGGDGRGPSITEQPSVITDRAAKDIIEAVISDQLGRKATADEIERYTKVAQRRAAKQPTVTTTTPLGGGRTRVSTQPGYSQTDFKSFLVDKIAGTDEAKAQKVLGYYETAMKVLAGE